MLSLFVHLLFLFAFFFWLLFVVVFAEYPCGCLMLLVMLWLLRLLFVFDHLSCFLFVLLALKFVLKRPNMQNSRNLMC